LARLRDVGRKKVKRAGADKVKQITGFTIGGVPPLGHKTSLPVYLDEELMQYDVVWSAAGTPRAVFAISPIILARYSNATISDLKS
jgi:prolyl-tRNA editing enzyme YbaK/EbsC (Cys-tRNA(Pro) deacylase)